MKLQNNKTAFSIIEILIGIFIFTLWIISIYAIISSSLRVNEYNKNYIIASNLAREQLELLRNNRDYNYEKLQKFDQINPPNINFSNTFTWSTHYKVSNNISGLSFPISIEELSVTDMLDDENYRLCLDTNNMYIYCPVWSGLKKTFFFKYVYVDRTLWNNQLKITSKVIWKARWVHDFEVTSILSDWKQL